MPIVGTKTSQLPNDGEPPDEGDFVAFVDVSAGRSEHVTVSTFAVSPAFKNRGVVLIWNGVNDYEPSQFKAGTQPKEFRGPVDPSTIPGIELGTYDIWVNTQP
jgi:hypothetical protein